MTDETPVDAPDTVDDWTDEQAAALLSDALARAERENGEPAASPWDDPQAARDEIERLRAESARYRTRSKDADAARDAAAKSARDDLAKQIGKALGLVADDTPPDPAELTKQLTQSRAERQRAQLELAVYRTASQAGADPSALLDSSSFLAKVSGVDLADADALATAIRATVEANPRFKATSQGSGVPPYVPAGDGNRRANTGPTQLTQQDLKGMTPEAIRQARQDGQLTDLMAQRKR